MMKLIPSPDAVQGQKRFLPMMILEILQNETDSAHPITKAELIRKIKKHYGFEPVQNTINAWLESLDTAGFLIERIIPEKKRAKVKGYFFNGEVLTDGQLRYMVDSVLFSDLITRVGAEEMIKALKPLGSRSFQKYIDMQLANLSHTRKSKREGFFTTVEIVQEAIFKEQQIRCNYQTCNYQDDRDGLTTENVYPEDITINPYELAYKNGRYFLIGTPEESEQLMTWRVDRLSNVQLLESKRRETRQMTDLRNTGGVQAYIEAQPVLCGGEMESFTIRCARSAIDEIVDAFGSNFHTAPDQKTQDDDDTVVLTVRATRASMKSWALTHADSMVVTEPADFRQEILDALQKAKDMYRKANQPSGTIARFADTFEEAMRLARQEASKYLYFRNRNLKEKKTADLSLLAEMPDLTAMTLVYCRLLHTEYLPKLQMLRRLTLRDCDYPAGALDPLTWLRALSTDDAAAAAQLCRTAQLRELALTGESITSLDFLSGAADTLRFLTLNRCTKVKDFFVLTELKHLISLRINGARGAFPDTSVLKQIPNLQSIRISDSSFKLEDAIRLHEDTGLAVYPGLLLDLDNETRAKLGLPPRPEREEQNGRENSSANQRTFLRR